MKKPKKEDLGKLIERVKKDASVFLSSEEGKILKKDIAKAAVALGLIASQVQQTYSGHSQGVHRSHSSHTDTHGNTHTNVAHVDAPHVDSLKVSLHNDIPAATSGLTHGHSDNAHTDSAHNDSAVNTHSNSPHMDHSNIGFRGVRSHTDYYY